MRRGPAGPPFVPPTPFLSRHLVEHDHHPLFRGILYFALKAPWNMGVAHDGGLTPCSPLLLNRHFFPEKDYSNLKLSM